MRNDQALTLSSHDKAIALWLLLCCAAIFVMVVLGGVTRLTGSGLSMVTWEPIMGAVPPLNETQWEETFQSYQQFPEFQYKNSTMSLEEFKGIFWFEYMHRLLGRLIGVIFFVPMLYFVARGHVSRRLKPKLIAIFALGGLQGLLGWYMVKSGLVNDPHVSQYRLTAHLGTAFIIYAFIFWTAMDLLFPRSKPGALVTDHHLGCFSLAITILVFVTVLAGGFVAGLKAGFIYNTFPLMGDRWIPEGVLALEPAWRNFFDNAVTVQFDHRLLATLVFVAILSFWLIARRATLPDHARVGIHLLLAAMVLQITLGISTLVLEVPVPLAATHQAGALILFTTALFVSHALWRR